MNYKFIIANNDVDFKKIINLIFNVFGGPKQAAEAIKKLNKNKTAAFGNELKAKLLVHLLSLYTGWSVERVVHNPEAIISTLLGKSSKNETRPKFDDSEEEE
jgi:hypothetical protein